MALTPTNLCLDLNRFFKIRPSLTTSKDGLIRLNIHLETTRI